MEASACNNKEIEEKAVRKAFQKFWSLFVKWDLGEDTDTLQRLLKMCAGFRPLTKDDAREIFQAKDQDRKSMEGELNFLMNYAGFVTLPCPFPNARKTWFMFVPMNDSSNPTILREWSEEEFNGNMKRIVSDENNQEGVGVGISPIAEDEESGSKPPASPSGVSTRRSQKGPPASDKRSSHAVMRSMGFEATGREDDDVEEESSNERLTRATLSAKNKRKNPPRSARPSLGPSIEPREEKKRRRRGLPKHCGRKDHKWTAANKLKKAAENPPGKGQEANALPNGSRPSKAAAPPPNNTQETVLPPASSGPSKPSQGISLDEKSNDQAQAQQILEEFAGAPANIVEDTERTGRSEQGVDGEESSGNVTPEPTSPSETAQETVPPVISLGNSSEPSQLSSLKKKIPLTCQSQMASLDSAGLSQNESTNKDKISTGQSQSLPYFHDDRENRATEDVAANAESRQRGADTVAPTNGGVAVAASPGTQETSSRNQSQDASSSSARLPESSSANSKDKAPRIPPPTWRFDTGEMLDDDIEGETIGSTDGSKQGINAEEFSNGVEENEANEEADQSAQHGVLSSVAQMPEEETSAAPPSIGSRKRSALSQCNPDESRRSKGMMISQEATPVEDADGTLSSEMTQPATAEGSASTIPNPQSFFVTESGICLGTHDRESFVKDGSILKMDETVGWEAVPGSKTSFVYRWAKNTHVHQNVRFWTVVKNHAVLRPLPPSSYAIGLISRRSVVDSQTVMRVEFVKRGLVSLLKCDTQRAIRFGRKSEADMSTIREDIWDNAWVGFETRRPALSR